MKGIETEVNNKLRVCVQCLIPKTFLVGGVDRCRRHFVDEQKRRWKGNTCPDCITKWDKELGEKK